MFQFTELSDSSPANGRANFKITRIRYICKPDRSFCPFSVCGALLLADEAASKSAAWYRSRDLYCIQTIRVILELALKFAGLTSGPNRWQS